MAYKQKSPKARFKRQYFEVKISKTGKPFKSSTEQYEVFDTEKKEFPNVKEARKYVRELYGKKRGQPMFVDNASGHPVEVGKIYGFQNRDISHPYDDDGKPNKWFEQDWVEIRKKKETIEPVRH